MIVHTTLVVILTVVAVLLIITVLLQQSKSGNLSGAISGGAEELFGGKTKVRGAEKFLERATTILSILFFVTLILITWFKF